jgi:hypothetical protein
MSTAHAIIGEASIMLGIPGVVCVLGFAACQSIKREQRAKNKE